MLVDDAGNTFGPHGRARRKSDKDYLGDVHTMTASDMFGVSPSLVTKEQRRKAKARNYIYLYSGGVRLRDDLFNREDQERARKRFEDATRYIPRIVGAPR